MPPAPGQGRHFPGFILLALAVLGSAHGRGIAQWLRTSLPGGMDPDLPAVYRTLADLERQGQVRSTWLTGRGPSRHVYRLTEAGWQALHERAEDARRSRDNLQFFLDRLAQLTAQGGPEAWSR